MAHDSASAPAAASARTPKVRMTAVERRATIGLAGIFGLRMLGMFIVLGVVFAWAVYRDMSMPEFDASLLTLMGISSGTYVGFKWPEKPKS